MNTDLQMVCVDVEKAFGKIPRSLIWWCLRKKGVPEEYVTIAQDMYRSSKTQVVTQKGETEYFPIEVGLHQGSVPSHPLFIITMEKNRVDEVDGSIPGNVPRTDACGIERQSLQTSHQTSNDARF